MNRPFNLKVRQWVPGILLVGLLQSCSHQTAYEVVQQNRLQDCDRLELDARDRCRAQYKMRYTEYKNARDAVVDPDAPR